MDLIEKIVELSPKYPRCTDLAASSDVAYKGLHQECSLVGLATQDRVNV